MEKDIPLTIEELSPEDEEKHRIISAKEIEFILRHLADKGVRVALYYGTGEFILTTVLGVDNTGLWLEQSPSSADNERVVDSPQLTVVSSHLQAKVQFKAKQVSKVEYQHRPAFYLPMPGNIYRLQRREYFRLPTPIAKPLRCIITSGNLPARRLHEVVIMDISAGGVALTCTETDAELTPGLSYPGCRIELPEIGTITGTIEVKNLAEMTLVSGRIIKRAGCEFKKLDSASTILLQRYVTTMQRAKAKS